MVDVGFGGIGCLLEPIRLVASVPVPRKEFGIDVPDHFSLG
jgi:hypothetical protein